jgi:hypothetical protein
MRREEDVAAEKGVEEVERGCDCGRRGRERGGSTPGYKVIKECMPRPRPRVGEHLRTC